VRRSPAIVRRVLPHRLALIAALLTVTLAAAILAALASFSATVTTYAVRTSLSGNPGTDISVTASVTSPAAAARGQELVVRSLRSALPGVPVALWGSESSDYLDILTGAGRAAQAHVIALSALPGHAALLAGSWPRVTGPASTPAGLTPAAAPVALARSLHLAPGSTLRLRASVSGAAAKIRITGIFRALHPASAYWLLDPPAAGVQHTGGFTVYPPLVTTFPVLAGSGIPVSSASFAAAPAVSRIRAAGLNQAAVTLQSGLSALGRSPRLPEATITTGLPGLLAGLGTALVVARSQLAIGVLILLVIAGATLALSAGMLSAQRQAETALLRSRGASRGQLMRTGLAEAALLVLPATVAGPLLGGLALPLLARRGPLAGSRLRLPVAFPAVAWVAAAAVAAGCLLILALPWLRAGGSPVRERVRRARRGALTAATRAGADLALLALAVLAGWQLAHHAATVSAGLDGSIGVDPVLVVAPVLALTAGAVVMLRLLPLVVRLGDRAAARGRRLTAAAAAWQVSRRPVRQAGPVLLAVLAVAISVLAVSQWSSWQRSAQDRASFATGADARVNLLPAAPLPVGRVADLTAGPAVRDSTPTVRAPIGLSSSATATLLALDARQAMSVAAIRPDLVGGSPKAMLAKLAPGPAAGSPVPARPARLLVTAALRAHVVGTPELFVQLTDAFGICYQVRAGALPANGRRHRLTVPVAPAGKAAYPLRISGFSLQYLMPARPPGSAVLLVTSVRGAATMTGAFGRPFAAGRAGQALSGSTTTDVGEVDSSPRVISAAVNGAFLRVEFAPGAGVFPANFGAGPTPMPASVSVTPAVPRLLPAAATSAFVAASGHGLGSRVPVSVGGTTVTVRIVTVISGFPTISGPSGGLIVDQARLQQVLADMGAQPQPVTEWWLRTSGRLSRRTLPPGAMLTERAAMARGLTADPLGAAPQLAMLAIALAALILAAAGFLVAAATARERARDLALLASLGATRRQLTRLLCLEQALLSVPAAAAGLVLGVLLAQLVVPAVTLSSAGARPDPPVLVLVPLAVPAVVALVIAAAPVLIAAFGAGSRAGLTASVRVEVPA
jgi:hypothetical protein